MATKTVSKAAAAILAKTPNTYDGTISVDVTDVAKLIRERLKATFPGTKFSLRCDRWSGGSGMYLSWTDGPTEKAVRDLTDVFSGKGFDGSIDLTYYYEHWLAPDGTVTVARRDGTTGSKGSVPEYLGSAPSADARLITIYSWSPSTSREISDETKAKLVEEIESYTGEAFEPNKSYPVRVHPALGWGEDTPGALLSIDTHEGDYGSSILWRLFSWRDFTPGAAVPEGDDSTYGCGVGKPARCCFTGKEVV